MDELRTNHNLPKWHKPLSAQIVLKYFFNNKKLMSWAKKSHQNKTNPISKMLTKGLLGQTNKILKAKVTKANNWILTKEQRKSNCQKRGFPKRIKYFFSEMARVAYGSRLKICRSERIRGFESLSHRTVGDRHKSIIYRFVLSPFGFVEQPSIN